MKVRYTTADKRMVFEFDSSDNKEVFDVRAGIEEIFEQEGCAACGGTEYRFVKRVSGKYTYRELFCKNPECGCSLGFGQKQEDQSLFPQRKDNDGNPKGKWGWKKWTPDDDQEMPVSKNKKK